MGDDISNSRHKRGRKPQHFRTRSGEVINGLARRPSDGRWRVIGTDITYTEPDEALAVHLFRTRYTLKAQAELIQLPVLLSARGATNAQVNAVLGPYVETSIDDQGQSVSFRSAFPDAIWAWVRQQILTHPQYVAQMTGIEQIGYLADLPKPTPSPTMEEVGQLYLDHAKISDNWRAKSKQFWQEFRDSVEVLKLREMTQEHVVDYADMIHGAAQTGTYARQRFGAIKTILNYPTKRGKWAEDAKRAVALCAVLVPPKKSVVNPTPISREAFMALHDAADAQMKAMLLLSLNWGMYGGEVAALDWTDLDLDKRLLRTHRSKTGIVRVAILWERTVIALQALPRPTEALFLTSGTKTRHNYQTTYKAFKALRATVEQREIQYSHIRDGAYTAAVESGVTMDGCRLLAGHATGISDHYVKRRPQMVAAACAAIEKAYFG